jgi:pimeloyl-ACP methyl ester carboxylesterase
MPDSRHTTGRAPLEIDKTVRLEINGSMQKIRLCAERGGLSAMLIVQAGPGFPLLHEAGKFQRCLHLESDFLVGYWEQRGCGNASRQDATSVSLQQQVEDLRSVLRWLRSETKQKVIVFGISLGATFALQAAEHESDLTESVIAISPDADTARSDPSAGSFLQKQSALAGNRRLSGRVKNSGTRRIWIRRRSNGASDCWPTWAVSNAARHSARCYERRYSA